MGTSVSQPSPKGRSLSGKSWGAVRKAFLYSEPAPRIFTRIFQAFTAEYREGTADKIVDAGVTAVFRMLQESDYSELSQIERYRAIGTLTTQARRELALSGINSFFAELAISCASATILSGENINNKFSKEFLSKVMDYILSRDLPMLIGSEGVMNLEETKALLNNLKNYVQTLIPAGNEFDPIVFLKNQITSSGVTHE